MPVVTADDLGGAQQAATTIHQDDGLKSVMLITNPVHRDLLPLVLRLRKLTRIGDCQWWTVCTPRWPSSRAPWMSQERSGSNLNGSDCAAFPTKADVRRRVEHVCLVPLADMRKGGAEVPSRRSMKLLVRRAQRSPLAAQLTTGQYSQGPGTQRKTSPATATRPTDGNDR